MKILHCLEGGVLWQFQALDPNQKPQPLVQQLRVLLVTPQRNEWQ